MCWLYGDRPGHKESTCPVCTRLAVAQKEACREIIAQKDVNTKHADQYAAYIKCSEATRVTRNEYVRTNLFASDAGTAGKKKKKHKEKSSYSVHSDDLWSTLKRRKTTVSVQQDAQRQALIAVVNDASVPLGVSRLFKFLAVLHTLGNHPESNVRFAENEEMLRRFTATHLRLIVGREEYDKHQATLLSIIDSKNDLSKLVHITWITNRQNGKTTTLAKFLAAMAMVSPCGGPLIYVYSTTRDRAVELIDGAKRYIDWIMHDKGLRAMFESLGLTVNRFVANNTIGFALPSFMDPRKINIIKARPKTADSCRGDAPKACMFDEVGFVTADFWFRFAYPLIQVGERVFTMATTPAHSGTFFAAFTDAIIKATIEEGHSSFTLINHSLVCDECLENGLGDECCHKLNMIPRWKSVSHPPNTALDGRDVLGFNDMKTLVPSKRMDDFQKEVYGVIAADNANYLPAKYVDKFFSKKNMKPLKNVDDQLTVYIAVDPPSHGISYSGLSAIIYTEVGQVYVVGVAEVKIKESEMIQLKNAISHFTRRVIEQLVTAARPYQNIRVVPIVECNNNSYQSNDLVTAITGTAIAMRCQTKMAFTKDFFAKAISEHIGVFTQAVEKLGGLSTLMTLMQDKRLVIWDRCVTIGEIHQRRMRAPSIDDALTTLASELKEFKETEKGPSGKTNSDNDDSALALILNVYWSYCIRANEMFADVR